MFFRALGFYSSSFLLVTISLDRYFAIVHPFSRVKVANQRAQLMILGAWVLAIIASSPQVRY
jgi:gonadotropin-releasing hormone receptor